MVYDLRPKKQFSIKHRFLDVEYRRLIDSDCISMLINCKSVNILRNNIACFKIQGVFSGKYSRINQLRTIIGRMRQVFYTLRTSYNLLDVTVSGLYFYERNLTINPIRCAFILVVLMLNHWKLIHEIQC